MDYFQARISIETSEYFRMLKEKYEQEANVNMTQAMVIAKAIDDVAAITDWEKIISDNSISLRKIEKDEVRELRLRVQISNQLENAIRNYKILLTKYIGTRSITIGVTLKLIFKGALLLKINPDIGVDVKNIDNIFENYEETLMQFIAPTNHEEFKNLLMNLKIELKKL